MEFELPKETVESLGLSEDQLKGISEHVTGVYVPTVTESLHNEYKEKGNKYANGILDGARTSFAKFTGIEVEGNEKITEYFERAGKTYLSKQADELSKSKEKYEKLVKEGKSDEAVAKQLEEYEGKLNTYKQKEADYDALIEGDYKTKYETLLTENKQTTHDNAFISVKPNFPDTVDEFRAKHFFGEFRKSIEEKYDIAKDGDEYICIDKTNDLKKYKLSELAAKDEKLIELSQGRQQNGLGSSDTKDVTLEGIPFTLPEKATSIEISAAITKHLTESGLENWQDEWGAKFAELRNKIAKAQQGK